MFPCRGSNILNGAVDQFTRQGKVGRLGLGKKKKRIFNENLSEWAVKHPSVSECDAAAACSCNEQHPQPLFNAGYRPSHFVTKRKQLCVDEEAVTGNKQTNIH